MLREADRRELTAFVTRIQEGDLLDLQAEYVATFDRGRKLSLHLFEHVHGQSRDRGQAMVDLLAQYRAVGLELAVKELPDYLREGINIHFARNYREVYEFVFHEHRLEKALH